MNRYYNQLSFLFLAVSLSFLFVLWNVGKQTEVSRFNSETRITGEQVNLRLAACVASRLDLVRTLSGLGWTSRTELMQGWGKQAAVVYPLYAGIQALNYVDENWVIQQVYPPESNLAALGKDLTKNQNESVRLALPRAEQSRSVVRTEIIDLLQSGKGFVFYQKIPSPNGKSLGFVNGVFRITDLMETCLAEENLKHNFRFLLREPHGQLVYASGGDVASLPWQHEVTFQIFVADQPWNMLFAPTPQALSERQNPTTDYLVLLGVMLVFFLFLLIRALLKNQSSLWESQQKYKLLIENQTDLVVKVDMQGQFLYISPSYCRMFGKTEEELMGKQFMPLVHEDDRELTEASLASLSHPPHYSYHEQRAMTDSGWRWLAWSNSGVLDSRGELEAITAVGRDVTEIKAMEERMVHNEKMKAIGEMAGGITHDFNNLLQVMLGNLEFVIDSPGDVADPTPLLVKVRNAVERAMQLTEKLSGLSRPQSVQRQVIDLNNLADDLMGLMGRTIPESISLKLIPAPGMLLVRADPTQVEQVILNMCFNARDAISSEGSIELRLREVELDAEFCRSHVGLEPGSYAQLSIIDSGKGIPENELGRIFDPFYTTKEPGSGTGLGLANCYSIVEQHNGIITANSVEGAGAEFSVFLPALPVDAKSRLLTPESSQSEPTGFSPGVILVVDDSEEVRSLACRLLQHAGYKTLEAENGQEAVEKFRANERDIGLVILDLVMPVMDGRKAAEEIRLIRPGVPLFFISGYSPDVARVDHLPGALLKKPFKGVELRNMVRKVFDTSTQSADGGL